MSYASALLFGSSTWLITMCLLMFYAPVFGMLFLTLTGIAIWFAPTNIKSDKLTDEEIEKELDTLS